jgi:hypothetical protein
MTIVYCDYKPKRRRKAKRAIEFPVGRIVSARPPQKRRRYIEFPIGVPDDAERSRRVAAFLERVLGPQD